MKRKARDLGIFSFRSRKGFGPSAGWQFDCVLIEDLSNTMRQNVLVSGETCNLDEMVGLTNRNEKESWLWIHGSIGSLCPISGLNQ